jgi:hypothetical protein
MSVEYNDIIVGVPARPAACSPTSGPQAETATWWSSRQPPTPTR